MISALGLTVMKTSTLLNGIQLARWLVAGGTTLGVVVGAAIKPVMDRFTNTPTVVNIRRTNSVIKAVDVEDDGQPSVSLSFRASPDGALHEVALVKGTPAECVQGALDIMVGSPRSFHKDVERIQYALAKVPEGKSKVQMAPRRPIIPASGGGSKVAEKRNPAAHVLEPDPQHS